MRTWVGGGKECSYIRHQVMIRQASQVSSYTFHGEGKRGYEYTKGSNPKWLPSDIQIIQSRIVHHISEFFSEFQSSNSFLHDAFRVQTTLCFQQKKCFQQNGLIFKSFCFLSNI